MGSFPTGVSGDTPLTPSPPCPCHAAAVPSHIWVRKTPKGALNYFHFANSRRGPCLPRYSPRLRSCPAAADTGSIPVARRAQHAGRKDSSGCTFTILCFHSQGKDELTVMDSRKVVPQEPESTCCSPNRANFQQLFPTPHHYSHLDQHG